jgi:adenosylmethionine-8-amino-7-oxononanoate aminotransferase
VGSGRTGTFTAIEQFGIVPDILTLGKGISGGYVPLSAVMTSKKLVEVIARGSGDFLHAQTFSHHAVLCAAGLAAMRYLEKHKLVERCAEVGPMFHDKLKPLAELPFVGDVRGRGLLAGIEFVLDKVTRAPFPREAKFAEKFTEAALQAGLIVWANVGHADGTNGDLIMFAPPFIVTAEQIDEMAAGFSRALETTIQQLGSKYQPAPA